MRFIFSVLLVLLALAACYVEEGFLFLSPPQIKKAAGFTFRAQVSFNFDQEKAFGSKRDLAVSQYIPLYRFLPDRIEPTRRKIQDLISRISRLQSEQQPDVASFSKYLKKELGVDISEQALAPLLGFSNIRNLLEAIATIQESILQGRIVEDSTPIKGKKTAEVLFPDPVGTVGFPATEFTTLEEARQDLKKKISQVFWQVDRNVLDPVIQISLKMLSANLAYDQHENDRRIEEIIRRYPSKIVQYRPGEVLVPFHKVMTEEDVLLLGAHQKAMKKSQFAAIPQVLFAFSFMVVLYNLLLSNILQPWLSRKPPILLFLSLLISSVLLFRAYLLFTSFPVHSLPFCTLPILLILLEREKVAAVWTTLLGATITGRFSGCTSEILFFFSIGGLLALLASPGIRKRSQVFIPAATAAAFNAVAVMVLLFDWKAFPLWWSGPEPATEASFHIASIGTLLAEAGWASLGGLASGPAALLILPLMEFAWRRASDFKLSKYADLRHPLLRDLLTKAPGTYQHTMSVAFLAEAAGEAIGANTLLLRTGAYYHDIGKMRNPRVFIENQLGGCNTHDDLDPTESAEIIIDHVRAGMEMGSKAGLPLAIVDFIPQHHGTRLVEFFYEKARRKEDRLQEPRIEDFRYPGPKPQSVEAALLMIVDAVEAASRTLDKPGRDKIEGLIWFIIEKRISEGQFDECDLSTREIGKIVQVLADSLEANFHARVEYPWQKEEKAGGE